MQTPLVDNLQIFPFNEIAHFGLSCQNRGDQLAGRFLLFSLKKQLDGPTQTQRREKNYLYLGVIPLLKPKLPLPTEHQQEIDLGR